MQSAPAVDLAAPAPRPGLLHTCAILLTAFVCGWALMSIEILGGRVLAPIFGSDVFTWGSLISTFLVALSIGYMAGGQLSRLQPRLGALATMVVIGGVLVIAIAHFKKDLSDYIFDLDLGDRLGPLAASVALFGLPALVLGMVSPYCVRLYATRLEHVGATSGFLYAVSTVGSTLGTLATSFFLIPNMEVSEIFIITGRVLVGLGIALAGLSLALRPRLSPQSSANPLPRGGIPALVGVLAVLFIFAPVTAAERILFEKESPYSRVTVVEDGSVRILRFARKGVNTEESRMDMRQPLQQLNEYTALMCTGLLFDPQPRDVLVIGLGGGVVPETIHNYYPNANIDVVEIDPVVVEAAQKFFLFKPDATMRAITQDGRVFVKRASRSYDLIFLDAFQGRSIPFHLKTVEFFRELQRILKPNGVVVSNLHRGPKLFDSERATYARAFATNYGFAGTNSGNFIVVSTVGSGPPLPRAVLAQQAAQLQAAHHFIFDLNVQAKKYQDRPDYDTSARPLTDDYAPVETLNQRP